VRSDISSVLSYEWTVTKPSPGLETGLAPTRNYLLNKEICASGDRGTVPDHRRVGRVKAPVRIRGRSRPTGMSVA
jgi:hypothetical protein